MFKLPKSHLPTFFCKACLQYRNDNRNNGRKEEEAWLRWFLKNLSRRWRIRLLCFHCYYYYSWLFLHILVFQICLSISDEMIFFQQNMEIKRNLLTASNSFYFVSINSLTSLSFWGAHFLPSIRFNCFYGNANHIAFRALFIMAAFLTNDTKSSACAREPHVHLMFICQEAQVLLEPGFCRFWIDFFLLQRSNKRDYNIIPFASCKVAKKKNYVVLPHGIPS